MFLAQAKRHRQRPPLVPGDAQNHRQYRQRQIGGIVRSAGSLIKVGRLDEAEIGESCDIPLGLPVRRSEEHTSELQSLMRISYAVFCLKKKTKTKKHTD